MKYITNVVAFATAAAIAGCSSSAPDVGPNHLDAVVSSPLIDAKFVKGYAHTAAHSKMRIGLHPASDSWGGFERVVGDEGVIAIGKHGVLLGVPNASSSAALMAPFTSVPEIHTARVLDYFIKSGLPGEQVGEAHVTTSMSESGATAELRENAKRTFVGYNTVLDRTLDGIRVSGSYAWARFNSSDDVVAEEVFWPDLPTQVFEDAKLMRSQLGTEAVARFKMMAKLAEEVDASEPTVAVVHSPYFQDTLESSAVVVVSSRTQGERHYKLDGSEFMFDYQIKAAKSAAK